MNIGKCIMVRIISLFAILFAQAFPLKSYAENLYEVLDIKSNFTLRVSEPIPTEYVFTTAVYIDLPDLINIYVTD